MRPLTTLWLIGIAFIAQVTLKADTKWLAGSWEGAFVRDGAIQEVLVDLSVNTDGWSGYYAIPELAIYEELLRDIEVSDSLLTLSFNYGRFELVPHADIEQLTGINTKWGPPVRLHLKRATAPLQLWFTKTDVTINSGEAALSATVFKPRGTGPFPLAVIVHGGGDSTRADWVYRSHAYALTQRGIAVVLYDQQGKGQSSGNREATLFELADDALAVLNETRTLPGIKSDRAGLIGVSRGGWVATNAAARSSQVNFLVLFQGPALSVEAQELDGLARTMRAAEFTEPQIDSAAAQARLYFELVNEKIDFTNFKKRSYSAARVGWSDFGHFADSADDADLTWWRLNAYDPAPDLRRIPCPVLALFAANDTHVAPESNLALMETCVKSSGRPFRAVVIPNLGHAVATYQTLRGGKWDWPRGFWVWSQRPPLLDDAPSSWIKALN